MTPLEIWDLVVDGKSLFAARDDADFPLRLARAIALLSRRHALRHVWIGGGGALRDDLPPALASLPLPFTISPLGPFVAAPGGFALAGTPRPLVVDVGQTAVKLMWREGQLRVERDFARAELRGFIVEAIGAARAQAGDIDCLVLALPAEIDDALVPAACSYAALAGDGALVGEVRARCGLERVPALVLNDAELAAVTAQQELSTVPALVLTLGYGVGAALVTRSHTLLPTP